MPAAPAPCSTRRFPTDLTDTQWWLLAPLLPLPRSGPGRPGRPATSRRALVKAILYVLWTGCPWRALPDCYPHWRTAHHHFAHWAADGTLAQLHAMLRGRVRMATGRKRAPTAAVIDSQSVRASDWVSRASKGYDAAKKVHGRKRHVAVDTYGLLLEVLVTPASTQDRDGGRRLLWRLRHDQPTIRLVWADAGYAGKLVTGPPRSSPWPCRLSANARACTTSRSCPAAGSWSAPSPGSASAAGWPLTTNASPNTTRHGCSGPWCA
jgi:transposase